MADNLTTTTTVSTIPSGTVIATDDAGAGGHVQLVKLAISTDGSATALTADNTDGLLVNLGTNNDVTVTGTVTANLGATDNAVLDQIEVNTSYGDSVGGGTEAAALRVTLANDSTGLISVDDNGGSLTIDNAALSVTGGGVESGALRVTIANDSTGVVSVDDGGGALTVDNAGTFAVQAAVDNAHSADYDSGAGTDTTTAFGIAVPASGGAAVVPGDATAGLKVDLGADNDVTVTGTVTANLSATDNAVLDQIELNTSYGDNTGNGTAAGSLRVTIASDTTGVLSVDDNGGALTVDNAGTFAVQVDAALPAGDNNIGNVDIVTMPATAAEAAALPSTFVVVAGDDGTDTHPLQLNASGQLQVDIAADSVGIGGGTQYTEDAAAASDPVGNAVILVRADTPATITSTDGDNVAQRATNYGAAFVQVLDSSGNFINSFGGSGGTSHTDDAAFSIGSASSITPTGYLADETTPDSVDEGDVGVPRMTLSRKPYAVITDATSENNAAVDGSGHLQVDIAADSVGIGGGTQYAVDTAGGATDTGTLALLVRDDTLTTLTPVDGDYVQGRTNSVGALWVAGNGTFTVDNGGTFAVQVDAALPAGDNNIGNVDIASSVALDVSAATVTVDLGANNDVTIDNSSIVHAEDAVHNTGDAGIMPLAVRNDVLAALAGTDGDYAPLQVNASGALFIQEGAALDVSAATVTVDGSGVTQPVSGTVTANLGATDNAVLDQIEVNTSYGDNTGNGTATGALRVTIASDTTGVLSVDDNGSTLSIDDGGGNISVDWGGTVPPIGAGTEAAALRVTLATDSTGVVSVDDNGGSLTIDGTVTASNATGNVAHDAADSGNPVKMGLKAVAHSANPTAVAANDRTDWYANRHGIPWVIGGHPNVQTTQLNVTDADGAQTNTALVTVAGGNKIVVTHITAACDNANTGDVQCRIGFGATATPANDAADVILSHPGIPAGGGISIGNGAGIIGVGADGEDLRLTCEDPAGGNIDITIGYYTIES